MTLATPIPVSAYSTPEERWQAVVDRSPAADGAFFFAVRTTGIYCRPSCPARQPKRENVTFFDTPEAAESAGFRACLRCKPGEVGATQRAVLHVKHLIDTSDVAPSLTKLAEAVGLSPFHLQRVFKRATGLSPKQYTLNVRSERLKAGLKAGKAVTTAMYDAGHDSPSTLYDPTTDALGMSPRAYQQGGENQTIHYALVSSPLGLMLVAATKRGLVAVRFGEAEGLTEELGREYPRAALVPDPEALTPYVEALLAHLAGRQPKLPLDTDLGGTAFQRQVWDALRTVPYGETRSYAQLAEMIGAPTAVRAVARACATNPIALVVPCHRIVRQSGELSSYRWGAERKRMLLDRERQAGVSLHSPSITAQQPT
ncbi:bifunctional DNA-binding transcriptional regulator/O6-methylguanine-DNA methyltransferase Ada [Deinococcus altitudinis]|uniref:bifunctional DNA-binding transcriptional regulator/O6-methylguanine-DNA methyltransferase Ada n=1 Tax=Deinococcus altitudinis TaxID=468914 RepID=UPI0038914638